jgi:succinate dehydrogenase/fumarate reductase flavoprotein subunit
MQADVMVIGAGLAGMMAAQAAQAEGAEVLVIDKGSIGRGTNSALSNGVFAAPTSDYSPEAYVEDTIQAGRRINDIDYVRLIAQEAPKTMASLRNMGLDLGERKGQFFVRTPSPDIIPGMVLVKTLARKLTGLEKVFLLKNFYVTGLLPEEKTVGVKGFDDTGREMTLRAPAVILAAGGAGGIYLRNDNQKSTMGQGYALAAKAGLSLRDMEFVQFYPLVLNEPRLPSMIVYPPYPKELRLVNSSGEDLLKKWQVDHINRAAMTKRDQFSVLLYEEDQKGPVYLDGKKVPDASWEELRRTLFKKVRFDFQQRSIAISPAVHFFMGGIRTDALGRTALPGLFACGEMVWGLHGANRRGGNALTECAVMGQIAGRNAALHALANPSSGPFQQKAPHQWTPGEKASVERLRELRQKMRAIAWNQAGILRMEAGMKQGLAGIDELRTQLERVSPHTVEERRLKEDLLSGVLITRAILTAGLGRQESRGSFIRRDFPREDDRNWLKNSCLTYDPAKGSFSLRHEEACE